ncbi:MAG: RNA polymerase sporulation sigma factor SigF [Tissierellia bacterium]|nr:RNA polymerase sporulation sigma factor SigF [Tissierellia bacterium]
MEKGNRDTQLLTHEETMELIEKAQKGDMEAKETLVKYNIGLVKSVLRGFTNRGYEIDDLFQIGSIGLLKAIDKFDPSYNVKFSTYAVPMIAGEIKRFLRDDGIIKVSRSLKQTANKIKQSQEKLSKKLGREPTIQEISDELDLDREEIVMALEASYHPDYLYDIVHEKEGNPLHLIDKVSLEEDNEKDILDRIVLQELLSELKERDRQVIFLRYFKDKTQMEVANMLGISQVQVSRIEKRIIREMKKKLAKA